MAPYAFHSLWLQRQFLAIFGNHFTWIVAPFLFVLSVAALHSHLSHATKMAWGGGAILCQ
jgi:hypothetical protein